MKKNPYLQALSDEISRQQGVFSKVLTFTVLLFFGLCVLFLQLLRRVFHISYESISVWFNLYLQGGLLTLTACLPFAVQCIGTCRNFSISGLCLTLLFAAYALLYVLGMAALIRHYPPRISYSFDLCVKDLRRWAAFWHISYWAINLWLFVFVWLTLIGVHLFLAFRLV